ncbi:MAG: hypothetical protein M1816_000230 [Peltula sp. TS41687]|nr:MAG: hypothetical protein M1816_000230 [Peltula sp. TS41687]
MSGPLRLMAASAGDVVGSRWDSAGRVTAEIITEESVVARIEESPKTFDVNFSTLGVLEIEIFVGRDEELAQIQKQLKDCSSRKTVVLHGLGGMGKTQLAVIYALRSRDKYSAVFWLNSKDVDTLKQGFLNAAKRIFRDHPSLTQFEAVIQSGNLDEAMNMTNRWLSIPKNDRWLLIYDNYDTPKLPGCHEPGSFDIKPFLPEAHQGAVIITTRASQLKIGHVIPVKKLQNIDHSLEIISHASGRPGLRNNSDAQALARELDGLPLALATAGAYLDQVSTSFAEYLRLYKASWLRLQQKTPQLLSYEDRALYSTWNLSLDHVKRQNDLSAKLLQLWAYFDNQDIWFELLQEGKGKGPEWFSALVEDQLSFDAAVRVLCNHALVEQNTMSGHVIEESMGYSMHSCVHSWTIHVLNGEWDLGMARLALGCVSWHVPSNNLPNSWIVQQRLIRHANRCWHLTSSGLTRTNDDLLICEQIHNLGILYHDQGKLAEAEKSYSWTLAVMEKALGPEHTSTLDTVHSLGNLYLDQGKLAEAEEMYMRALAGYEKALGPEHTSTLHTVNNLGNLYRNQGKLAEAEEMYMRALAGYEKALGSEHTSIFDTVNNLGILYWNQGKLAEAEEMYMRALAGCEKALGPEHPSTLHTVNNLGNLYGIQGKLAEAEEMYMRALAGREKALGPEHTSTLDTVYNLGILYGNQGKLAEAEEMYMRALAGYEKALGPEHTSRLDTVNNLAFLYQE